MKQRPRGIYYVTYSLNARFVPEWFQEKNSRINIAIAFWWQSCIRSVGMNDLSSRNTDSSPELPEFPEIIAN